MRFTFAVVVVVFVVVSRDSHLDVVSEDVPDAQLLPDVVQKGPDLAGHRSRLRPPSRPPPRYNVSLEEEGIRRMAFFRVLVVGVSFR